MGGGVSHVLAAVFLAISMVFVYRSFTGCGSGRRIDAAGGDPPQQGPVSAGGFYCLRSGETDIECPVCSH